MILSTKASSKNDPDFWKAKVNALTNENREPRCRLDTVEKELQLVKQKKFTRDAYSDKTSSRKSEESPSGTSTKGSKKNKEVIRRESDVLNVNSEVIARDNPKDKATLETVKLYLDKFSTEITHSFGGIARNLELLVKSITGNKEQQQKGDGSPCIIEQQKVSEPRNKTIGSREKRVAVGKKSETPNLVSRKFSTPKEVVKRGKF